MEIDPRIRLPFHDPDEAEQSYAGAAEPSGDAQLRHLQRVPLFSGSNEDELRRVAELSRIVEVPAGTVITQIGDAGDSFFIIIDGMAAVRTPVGAGSQLQPRGLLWRDEPGGWGAPIGDDRGDNRSPAARRGSLPILATAG
jgi:hypothetical protein